MNVVVAWFDSSKIEEVACVRITLMVSSRFDSSARLDKLCFNSKRAKITKTQSTAS